MFHFQLIFVCSLACRYPLCSLDISNTRQVPTHPPSFANGKLNILQEIKFLFGHILCWLISCWLISESIRLMYLHWSTWTCNQDPLFGEVNPSSNQHSISGHWHSNSQLVFLYILLNGWDMLQMNCTERCNGLDERDKRLEPAQPHGEGQENIEIAEMTPSTCVCSVSSVIQLKVRIGGRVPHWQNLKCANCVKFFEIEQLTTELAHFLSPCINWILFFLYWVESYQPSTDYLTDLRLTSGPDPSCYVSFTLDLADPAWELRPLRPQPEHRHNYKESSTTFFLWKTFPKGWIWVPSCHSRCQELTYFKSSSEVSSPESWCLMNLLLVTLLSYHNKVTANNTTTIQHSHISRVENYLKSIETWGVLTLDRAQVSFKHLALNNLNISQILY